MTDDQRLEKLYNLKGSGLELKDVLARLGHPETRLKCIRVGGTNGKGSTCAFLAQILQTAGYRVGLFTSPHLVEPEERIQINGEKISRAEFLKNYERVWSIVQELHGAQSESIARFFEIVVAMALLYFSEQGVDIALIEAGVGGRRDDTNVVTPLFSILTSVDLDHQEVLGETIEAIAEEKAGIAPSGVTLLTSETKPKALRVMARVCDAQGSDLVPVDLSRWRLQHTGWDGQRFDWGSLKDLETQMLGDFQSKNAATALAAIELLRQHGFHLDEHAIREGLKKTRWPGRMELLHQNPYLLLDGAKNPAGLRALRSSLGRLSYEKLVLVLGISTRKEISEMVAEIVPIADTVIVTQAPFRGSEPALIAREVRRFTCAIEIMAAPGQALCRAFELANENDLICVTGSLFLVGATRDIWQNEPFAKVGEIG
jgi:dihydrofolate synthase/folylpolyglutamate synthase